MKDIVLIDDTAKYWGGACFTLYSLLDGIDFSRQYRTSEITPELLSEVPHDSLFIIGNIMDINNRNHNVLRYIFSFSNFIKIEFDYNFCKFRDEFAFRKFTGEYDWEPFSPNYDNIGRDEIYSRIISNSRKHFFMSEDQIEVYKRFFGDIPKAEVLSSSFSENHLALMDRLRNQNVEKNGKAIIVDGNGGWHSEGKGVYDSIKFCKSRNIPFDLVKCADYDKFLEIMSRYSSLVFLPVVRDTCPRVVIEAAMLGLEVMTNDNCQHITEDWFIDQNPEKIKSHIRERKQYFQKAVKELICED